MSKRAKALFSLVIMALVLAYTAYNYVSGKVDLLTLLIAAAVLGIPFVNMVNFLIQDLKK